MQQLAMDATALVRGPDEVSSSVLRVILERARTGSQPRRRSDDHIVCLAVEGGGMRGAVSAGMCVVLEAAGLVPAFDRIYGVSSGALNASITAAGQAALGATNYQDAASRRVINPMRPLLRRPVIDFDFLFENLIATRRPLSFSRLLSGPDFRALATSLDTLSLRVLKDFADAGDVMHAVRASASLPAIGGPPMVYRGERMLDGGLIESIPSETALREGATHVLVLRSRPAGYRRPPHAKLAERLALREHPELAELLRDGPYAYNRHASELARMTNEADVSPVFQIAVPERTRLIGRLEANGRRVVEALQIGAAAMASTILRESIELRWQPVAYSAVPGGRPAAEALLGPTAG